MSGSMHKRAPRKRLATEPIESWLSAEDTGSPHSKRPAATVIGVIFVLGRACAGALWLTAFTLQWPEIAREVELETEIRPAVYSIFLVGGLIGVLLLVALGIAIWRGSNLARVLVMLGLTLSISVAAIGYFTNGEEITIRTTLLTVALDIIVLLALSSRDARAWARSRSRRRAAPRPRT